MTTNTDADLVAQFTKSTFSNGGDNCVEVGLTHDSRVAIRHSKHHEQPAQFYTRDNWAVFLVGVKDGEFNL